MAAMPKSKMGIFHDCIAAMKRCSVPFFPKDCWCNESQGAESMLGRLCVVSIIIAFVLLTAATAETVETRGESGCRNAISAARGEMWKAITSGQGSGASVAILDHDKMVYSEGFGVANRSENRPVDKYTRFNIGSTSKMFAAVAVLLLVDEGKVSLDESVAKYIPEFRMKDMRYKDITVRMLFNHSSGLPGSSIANGPCGRKAFGAWGQNGWDRVAYAKRAGLCRNRRGCR
jgi:CubicO group peptidase (beta-lactamase class C family)